MTFKYINRSKDGSGHIEFMLDTGDDYFVPVSLSGSQAGNEAWLQVSGPCNAHFTLEHPAVIASYLDTTDPYSIGGAIELHPVPNTAYPKMPTAGTSTAGTSLLWGPAIALTSGGLQAVPLCVTGIRIVATGPCRVIIAGSY